MKLFGEYLVEKNLVNEGQLLIALVKQVEAQPSVVKVVCDLNLLKTDEVLQALKKQTLTQCSFVDAAKSLALWSDEKTQKLLSELSSKRTPLGELLIQERVIDLPTLTRALDDFFGERASEPATIPKEETSESSPQSSNQFSEVFDFLNDHFFHAFRNALNAVANGKLEDASTFTQLADEMHKISGVAKLYEFQEMAGFLDTVENSLRETTARKPEKIGTDIIKKIHSALRDCNEALLGALSGYESGSILPTSFSEGPLAEKVKSVTSWFTLIEFDLSLIEKEPH